MPLITAYRICKTKYSATSFDGEGAFRSGGRWNSKGTRMVYTGGSLSLAALEMLVHLDEAALLLAYSFVQAQFDEDLVLTVKISDLPADWTISPAPDQLKEIGDEWFRSKRSAVLRVPSVIVPIEANYLINPEHADFDKIEISNPESFEFDERLKQ